MQSQVVPFSHDAHVEKIILRGNFFLIFLLLKTFLVIAIENVAQVLRQCFIVNFRLHCSTLKLTGLHCQCSIESKISSSKYEARSVISATESKA